MVYERRSGFTLPKPVRISGARELILADVPGVYRAQGKPAKKLLERVAIFNVSLAATRV